MNRNLYLATVATILFFSSVSVQAIESKSLATNSAPQVLDVKTSKSIDNMVGNFNNKIEIIFSDIDGTLVPFESTGVQALPTKYEKLAAQKLIQAKIPLVLTTGRAPNEVSEIVDGLGSVSSYFILQQGALILDPKGQTIYQDFLKNKDTKDVVKEFISFRKAMNFKSKFYVVANAKQYSTEEFFLPYNGTYVLVVKSLDEFGDDFCFGKIEIYEPDLKKIRLIQADLKKKFPHLRIDVSGVGYCCITSPTATKGNAVKWLAEMLNVDLKNAATLGDAENDLSMLKLTRDSGGLAIALGNALDSVKDAADYVSSPVTEGGWAKAIDKILENNKLLSTNKKSFALQKH